jgi:hypothetical protein
MKTTQASLQAIKNNLDAKQREKLIPHVKKRRVSKKSARARQRRRHRRAPTAGRKVCG